MSPLADRPHAENVESGPVSDDGSAVGSEQPKPDGDPRPARNGSRFPRLRKSGSGGSRGLPVRGSAASMQAFASFNSSKVSKARASSPDLHRQPGNLASCQEASTSDSCEEGSIPRSGRAQTVDCADKSAVNIAEQGDEEEASADHSVRGQDPPPLPRQGSFASSISDTLRAAAGLRPAHRYQHAGQARPKDSPEAARHSKDETPRHADEDSGAAGGGDGGSFSKHVDVVSRQKMAW